MTALRAHTRYSNRWIYPPLVSAPSDFGPAPPQGHATTYSLPATHTIRLSGLLDTDEAADFLIALVGLVDGVRLTRAGWSHFHKAPLKLHTLVDIVADAREIQEILRLGIEFWVISAAEVRALNCATPLSTKPDTRTLRSGSPIRRTTLQSLSSSATS